MASSKSDLGVVRISKRQADRLKQVAVELSKGNMIPLPPMEWEEALTEELGEVYTRSESMHAIGKRFRIEVVAEGEATGIFDPHGNPVLLGQAESAPEPAPTEVKQEPKRKKWKQKLPEHMRKS